jgi:stage III sporulation protein AG
MGEQKGPIPWLKKLLFQSDEKSKGGSKLPYLLMIFLFGIGLLLFNELFTANVERAPTDSVSPESGVGEMEVFVNKSSDEAKTIRDYEQHYESELKEALEQIIGVDDVTVVVNIDASEKKIFEKNVSKQEKETKEADREGGTRNIRESTTDEQMVFIQEGDKEVPIVLETKKPSIRGVLVVAKGADNIQVKKWIIEAVTRVLDVPSHRVSVMPKKSKEES